MQRFRAKIDHYLRSSDGLAGDAVLIAPVSSPDSLQTGNFSGNWPVWQLGDPNHSAETATVQQLLAQFPASSNREFYSANRVSKSVRGKSATIGIACRGPLCADCVEEVGALAVLGTRGDRRAVACLLSGQHRGGQREKDSDNWY